MEGVGAAVVAGALEAGHQSQVAGGDLGHDVGEDHGVVPAVAPGHEADPVAADILSILDEMILLIKYNKLSLYYIELRKIS